MKYIFTTMLLVSVSFLNAQTEPCNCFETKEQEKNFEEKILGRAFVNQFLGSANQFHLGWLPGDLILKDGSVIKGENFRYNRYLDELLWVRKKDYAISIVQKDLVASFILYDSKMAYPMVFINLKKKSWLSTDSGSFYMQEMAKGKLSFYVFRKAQKIGNNKEMDTSNDYYIVKDDIFYKVRLSRRSLYKFMGLEKETMRNIVRENDLNLKDEHQFAQALKIYNKQRQD